MEKIVNVIGAGLAGCEAAYQLSKRGIKVKLYEMKKHKKTPAQKVDTFAELVCSNSFRSSSVKNAVGLMKEELRLLDSLIIKVADRTKVKAGESLSVDRNIFSEEITKEISSNPLIEVIDEEVTKIPDGYTILATGPLTSDALSDEIGKFIDEEYLHFYDAIAPVIEKDSIDFTKAYYKSRWDKGSADYINCPFTKEEYLAWYKEVIEADTHESHDFEINVFEGCMPFEEMAKRGVDTLRFGPMKPVGLHYNGLKPYAVVQLRQDNLIDTMYNIVGFQTKLSYPSQDKIIRMIPGLEKAKIIRHGQMHRNTFISAPGVINASYQSLKREDLFFAGQLSGVEGYVESTASGLVAAINMAKLVNGEPLVKFPRTTAIGSQAYYLENASKKDFVPMNTNYGIFPSLEENIHKSDRKEAYSNRALNDMKEFISESIK
ncbi:MAG: methylenetetrahydrofolate--tRNA-(uracil(54)-C(5))-methyltransferase (FADH(2)-oxidizing) TrmFO [Gammaproteobacteria bacterium]|nr:methylenetetrahydrofolate--tRNA-(uracil(54)-C(5))-methyltransferase (FADH(2)-oxidizing) TrmFO [Gammaproteobacteria bacterium]